MKKSEILQCVANNHNRLVQIMVKGDDAIMMGDVIKDLRILANMLQNDIESEKNTAADKHGE